MLGQTRLSTRYASMPRIFPKGKKLLNTPPALHYKGALSPTPSSSPLCQVPHSRRASTAAHASVLLDQHETSPAHRFNTLLNKKLSLNPFATFSDWISRHFLALDLGLAASSADSLPSSVGLAAASGAFIATKCDAVSIALRGVFSNPTALFLQDVLDPLPGSIVALVLAVAAAFVSLWLLRGWWAAQMLMATPSSQPRASSSSSHSSSSSSSGSSSSGGSHAFEAEAPHPTWQGTLLGLGRLGCIIWAAQALAGQASITTAAAAYALSLLLLGPIASTLTAALAPALSSTLLGRASSTAPQPAPVQQQQQQQQQQTQQGEEGSSEQLAANALSQPSPPSSPPANASASTQPHPLPPSTSASVPAPVLALLGTEVAFLVLQLKQLPVAAVAVCGLAVAGLTAAVQGIPDMQQRLEPHKVAVGDLVVVHLSLALENGIVIDSTHGGQPLCFRVGSAREDLGLQLEEEEPGVSGASTSDMGTIGRQRFMQLVPAADAALEGSLRGTRTSFSIFNPSFEEGGFVNPELVWSQPRDEAKRKFGGLLPIPGQVFMYPIGGHRRPHDWVPVMVTGVDDKAVHLNANYSVEATAALVHVDVQSLYKHV